MASGTQFCQDNVPSKNYVKYEVFISQLMLLVIVRVGYEVSFSERITFLTFIVKSQHMLIQPCVFRPVIATYFAFQGLCLKPECILGFKSNVDTIYDTPNEHQQSWDLKNDFEYSKLALYNFLAEHRSVVVKSNMREILRVQPNVVLYSWL